jgi:hydrogenase expression/formation protein HypE
MSEAVQEAGVIIACGDTKVVEKGAADRLFINTAGIGAVPEGIDVSVQNGRPGDSVIVSGTMGDHGMTILTQRQGLALRGSLASDAAPLNGLVGAMLTASPGLRALRDPTRGGLATTLNEIARSSKVGIEIEETAVPISEAVQAACEMLGLDPLYLANEGKLVAVVPADDEERVLAAMRQHRYGVHAAVVGRITEDHPGRVVLKTPFGLRRVIDVHAADQFPRIC